MPDQLPETDSAFQHVPVLADALLNALNQEPSDHWQSGLVVDATLGGGGQGTGGNRRTAADEVGGAEKSAGREAEEEIPPGYARPDSEWRPAANASR